MADPKDEIFRKNALFQSGRFFIFMNRTKANVPEHKQQTTTCPHCGKEFTKTDLRKYCSNCFACTGCERYLCAACDEVIEIVPVRPMNYKSSSRTK